LTGPPPDPQPGPPPDPQPGPPPDPQPGPPRDQLRDVVLDAAAALIADRGWRHTRMADVAAAAGVSRQTLYQHYGSRGALEGALVLREADRFLHDVEQAVAEYPSDPQAATSAAFEVFRTAVAQSTLIKSVTAQDGSGQLMAVLDAHSSALLSRARGRLEAAITAVWPRTDPADAALVAECLVRLAISHLTMPGESSALTGDGVARLLGPFVLARTGRAR
jgi:AcrR family transcriptional regulator